MFADICRLFQYDKDFFIEDLSRICSKSFVNNESRRVDAAEKADDAEMSVSNAEDLLKSRAAGTGSHRDDSTQDVAFDEDSRSVRRRETIIYPLFSEISQAMNVPSLIYFVFDCVLLFRFLACSLWFGSDRFWVGERTGFMASLRPIMDFGAGGLSESGRLGMASFFISFAWLVLLWHLLLWR
jgi:hypothetical protein